MTRRAQLFAGSFAVVLTVAALAASRETSAGTGAQTDARVELGRRLFSDPVIGRAGKVSCAACHDPEHGYSDARVQSVDETGALPRHSQPLTDLRGRGFHWDGEFDTVRQVVEARVLPREVVAMRAIERSVGRAEESASTGVEWSVDRLRDRASAGLLPRYYGDGASGSVAVTKPAGESLVDDRLAISGYYGTGFAAAYGSAEPTLERVVDAVDAYVRTLRTGENSLDRYLAGDEKALGAAARAGHALFVGKAGCVECHVENPQAGRALLTDGLFHDTGIGWDTTNSGFADRGAGATELRPSEDGKFKTPSLRDVALRAPYMHDGRFATLEEVVRYYDEGGTPHAVEGGGKLDPRIRKLGLSDLEVGNLVAFLSSLSGKERAGLADPHPDRPRLLRVRIVDIAGAPLKNAEVTMEPAGERLRNASAPRLESRVTGRDGEAAFPWPATTHALVTCVGQPAVEATLVPDYVSSLVITKCTPERDLYAIPTSLCEGSDTIRAVPKMARGRKKPVGLSLIRPLSNGRTLFASDADLSEVEGPVTLTTIDGRTIGVYDVAKWAWDRDGADLRPVPPALPDGLLLDPVLIARLDRLLGAKR